MDSYEKLEARVRQVISALEARGSDAWARYKSRDGEGGNAYDEGISDCCEDTIFLLKEALKGDTDA